MTMTATVKLSLQIDFTSHPTGDGRIGLKPIRPTAKGRAGCLARPPRSPFLTPRPGRRLRPVIARAEPVGPYDSGCHGRGGLPGKVRTDRLFQRAPGRPIDERAARRGGFPAISTAGSVRCRAMSRCVCPASWHHTARSEPDVRSIGISPGRIDRSSGGSGRPIRRRAGFSAERIEGWTRWRIFARSRFGAVCPAPGPGYWPSAWRGPGPRSTRGRRAQSGRPAARADGAPAGPLAPASTSSGDLRVGDQRHLDPGRGISGDVAEGGIHAAGGRPDPSKNVAHTMAMNLAIFAVGMMGFWACGFALMFGGHGPFAAWGARARSTRWARCALRPSVGPARPRRGSS